MKKMSLVLLVAVAVLAFASFALAGEEAKTVTVTGKLMCAQCSLHKADAEGCQNVLVATTENGKTVEYYLAKNPVSEKVGYGCSGTKTVTATGTVAQKDDKTWFDAKTIEVVAKG